MIPKVDSFQEKKILDWLEKNIGFENFIHALERSLDRLKPLINRKRFSDKIKVITIAGTNGKGETSLNIANILKHNSKSFTLFSSPHVFTIRERFQSEKGLISYKDLNKFMDQAYFEINQSNLKLSYFEFLFFTFYLWSIHLDVDYIILEVGLGGRLDATNILDTDVAVITSIGRDHQQFLGNSLSEILHEKIAISRSKKPLVTNLQLSYLNQIVAKYCANHGIVHYPVEKLDKKVSFHVQNWRTAKKVAKILDLEVDDNLQEKRRWRKKIKSKEFIFYGGHNPDGTRAMVNSFCRESMNFSHIIVSFSKRSEEDVKTMLNTLLAYVSKKCKIFITENNNFKSFPLEEIKDIFHDEIYKSIRFTPKWENILSEIDFTDESKVLVTGSYYFIAPFYGFLSEHIESSSL